MAAIDGTYTVFYIDSFRYDANGTADSFAASVPAPAAAPLALAAFGLLGAVAHRRRRAIDRTTPLG